MHRTIYICVFLVCSSSQVVFGQKQAPYTNQYYGNLTYFFTDKEDMISFFDLQPGMVVADIGAKNGMYEVILSMDFDSITMYAEDVDPKKLNAKKIDQNLRKYKSKIKQPFTNKIIPVIGTYQSTHLPEGIFDAIIIMSAFHEFTYMEDMMNDISKKLKPDGKIFILDVFSYLERKHKCNEGHRSLTVDTVEFVMNHHGFYLIKMTSPEQHQINSLVFQRNIKASDKYLMTRIEVSTMVDLIEVLYSEEVAIDTTFHSYLKDQIQLQKKQLKEVYPEFDSWIESIGFYWIKKKKYNCAYRAFSLLNKTYPERKQVQYWLKKMEKKIK